jgi:metallo-beta-lactamase family protein
VKSVDESKSINNKNSSIVISASGMMNAGRIRHHLFNTLEHPENTILIVGYAGPGTTGGVLRSGAKSIRMFGQVVQVNAKIVIMDSFSAHGDYNEMIHYLRSQQKDKLRKLFLVHGDHDALDSFKGKLEQEGYEDVHIAILGESVSI